MPNPQERELVGEPIPEYVGGAGKTIDDKNVKGAILPQNDDAGAGERAPTTEFISLKDGTRARRQPLATRHLDPNERGWDPTSAETQSTEARRRYKCRKGFVFLYGKKLAYKGVCYLWLTDEEIVGQEHKLEAMPADPIHVAKPDNVALPVISESRTVSELQKRRAALAAEQNILAGELQIAEREEAARNERLGIKGAVVDVPGPNIAAEGIPPEAFLPGGGQVGGALEGGRGVSPEAALSEHTPSEDEQERRGPGRPAGSKDKAPRRRRAPLANVADTPGGVNPADK